LIRIEALGPTGDALKRQNAQLTHILISGMWIPDAGSNIAQSGAGGKRVWVVKVVRREAVVSHHLHYNRGGNITDILRLALTHSCSKRFTVFHPLRLVKETRILPTHPLAVMPTPTLRHPMNVSSVSLPPEMSSFFRADI